MDRAPLADFLVPDGFAGPRGLRALARESSVVGEAVRYRRRVSADRHSRRGTPYVERARETGDPVLLVPGFLAGDYTLTGMNRHLRRQGYRVYRSGILANVGCIDRSTEALERRVEHIAARRERKVVVVGHSLGGMIARGLAARRPDLVSGIVTMGSPMLAPGAAHDLLLAQVGLLRRLSGMGLSRLMGEDCTSGSCALTMFEESRRPLPDGFPFLAVYSRRDGICDWRACIDPAARAVEVRTSHCGMALDPLVFDLVSAQVAEIQARPEAERRWAWIDPITAADAG